MAEKVTMVLEVVDLQCCRYYKKVKKILSKFPEIQDQKYDEKTNTVTITVVCCSPEKLMDKICCKGCGFINTIEIKSPTPPPTPKKTPPPTPKKTPPPSPKKPDPIATIRFEFCCTECSCGQKGGPCHSCKPPPPPCHCRPFCDSCGCGCGCGCRRGCGCGGSYRYCHVSHGGCSCEDDPRGCSIM